MQPQTVQAIEHQMDELPIGTELLHGQYTIEQYLGRGGFGITYLARDSLDREVVIKECFPTALCYRVAGKVQSRSLSNDEQYSSIVRHFVREARRLAKLSHENIVGVHQVFQENNSAYMALDFIDGVDLLTILEDCPERLTPEFVRDALLSTLEAISYTHTLSILHRDISPDNLLLDADNKLTLIDFGAARECAGKDNDALSAIMSVKDGYSPHEFYLNEETQTPSSDLYSLAATFYHIISGGAPPDSQERLAALAAGKDDPYQPLVNSNHDYDHGLLASLDQALEILQKDRIQTAEEWIGMLNAKVRRLPALKLEANWNVDLQRTISRLVKDVNKNITPGHPGSSTGKNGTFLTTADPIPTPPPEPVDIFGNRINDVNAWLKEQDRRPKKRGNRKKNPEQKQYDTQAQEAFDHEQEHVEDGDGEQPSKSVLSRLLAGQLPPRRIKISFAFQN